MFQIAKDDIAKLFYSVNERVGAILELSVASHKRSKRKNLVMTVSITKPTIIQFYIVKAPERSELRKIFVCNTNDLKKLDCRDSNTQPTYDLQLVTVKKTWSFTAARLESKHTFLAEVRRITFILQPNTYKNITMANFTEDLDLPDINDQEQTLESVLNPDSVQDGGVEEPSLHEKVSTADAYRSLTPREEQDVREFLQEQENMGVHRSETEMTECLQDQLANLEGTNIYSIVSSETQSRTLMHSLDKAIEQAEYLDKEVNAQYDLIVDVKDAMLTLFDRDQLVQVYVDNQNRLVAALSDMVSRYSLDPKYVQALMEVDLSSLPKVALCTEAAQKLDALLRVPLKEGEKHMRVLSEGLSDLESLSETFTVKLVSKVNDAIIHSNTRLKLLTSLQASNPNVSCPSLCSIRQPTDAFEDPRGDLIHLAPLVGDWLQSNHRDTFIQVKRTYTERLQPILTRQIKEMLRVAYLNISNIIRCKKNVDFGSRSLDGTISESMMMLSVSSPEAGVLKQVGSVFETLLDSIVNFLSSEEAFLVQLFRFKRTQKTTRRPDDDLDTALGCMQVMFQSVDQSLAQCLVECGQLQPTIVLPFFLWACLKAEPVEKNTDSTSGSYLALTMGQVVQTAQQHFQNFVHDLIDSFKSEKPSKKSQSGLPRMVRRYMEFIDITNELFEHSNRKQDIEWAHKELIKALISQVERVASESVRTPREVVQLESYHRLKDGIRKVKTDGLKEFRNEVANRYSRALHEYTVNCMGRPLDKLAAFFDRIQESLDAGLRPEMIQYQFAFSKQGLVKVIKEYPGKEIKHGLEVLCKKVEKHLSEEGNLFLVVWHSIQAEFFEQLNHFNSLIDQCYPGSNIRIAFTTNDLQIYFTEIAQSR